jgi:hypothetical protein
VTTNAVSDLERLVDVLRREARLVTVANFRLGVLYDLLCDAIDADEPPTAEAYAAADAAEQVLARLRREELHRALVTAGLGLTLGLGAEPSLADLALRAGAEHATTLTQQLTALRAGATELAALDLAIEPLIEELEEEYAIAPALGGRGGGGSTVAAGGPARPGRAEVTYIGPAIEQRPLSSHLPANLLPPSLRDFVR